MQLIRFIGGPLDGKEESWSTFPGPRIEAVCPITFDYWMSPKDITSERLKTAVYERSTIITYKYRGGCEDE